MNNKYYELLTRVEQKCYNEILTKIESYKAEWSFSQTSFDFIVKVYRSVLKDHPEYFWLSPDCEGTTITSGSELTVLFRPKIEVEINQIMTMRQKVDNCVKDLISKAKRRSLHLYEQVLFIHDYLVMNTDYVLNTSHCYDAYGCLILHRAVCSGYAAAFQMLMKKLGVECGRISGWSSSKICEDTSHVWNYVKLSDGYYYIDVTWDDPIINNGVAADNLSHDFFCVNLNEMRLTHRFAMDQFIPQNYGAKYDYYRYKSWYMDTYSFSALRMLAMRQLQCSDRFFVKFGSKTETERAMRDLLDMQKVFSIPGISQRISYGVSKSGLILSIGEKR